MVSENDRTSARYRSNRTSLSLDWARAKVLDPTHINTYSDSHTGTTDVVVYDGYYSTLSSANEKPSERSGSAAGRRIDRREACNRW